MAVKLHMGSTVADGPNFHFLLALAQSFLHLHHLIRGRVEPTRGACPLADAHRIAKLVCRALQSSIAMWGCGQCPQAVSCLLPGISALFGGNNLRPLLVGCSLMLFQQITGQPSVLYYASQVPSADSRDWLVYGHFPIECVVQTFSSQ